MSNEFKNYPPMLSTGNLGPREKGEIIQMMEKTVRDRYGEAVLIRMQKKMMNGRCDQCFKEDCNGYCFPCNIGLCNRCNKVHLRTHGIKPARPSTRSH